MILYPPHFKKWGGFVPPVPPPATPMTGAPKAMIRDLLDNCYDDPDFDIEEVWEELE